MGPRPLRDDGKAHEVVLLELVRVSLGPRIVRAHEAESGVDVESVETIDSERVVHRCRGSRPRPPFGQPERQLLIAGFAGSVKFPFCMDGRS